MQRARGSLWSRLTYANVMATVAVFLGLGGGAYAAINGFPDPSGVFHGCVNKQTGTLRLVDGAPSCHNVKTLKRGKHTVRVPGEFAVAWNQQGQQGLQGLQGLRGATGQPGSPAASASTAHMLSPTYASPPPWFGAVSGFSQGVVGGDADVTQLSPNAPVVARDLAVQAVSTPSGDTGFRVTLMADGTATALSCEFRTSTNGLCNSGDTTALVVPGSRLSFRVEPLASGNQLPGGTDLLIGWRATTP